LSQRRMFPSHDQRVMGETSGDATLRWAEGAWSDVQGYPVSITFLADRAVYAANRDVWLSSVGDYEIFDVGSRDDDSFSIVINTGNAIRWVENIDKTLAIGTTGKSWSLQTNRVGTPITPTNYTVDEQSGDGSSTIQPLKIDNALVYADLQAKRIMRYTFDTNEAKYLSDELSILAEHFTKTSTVTWLAYQEHPEPIIWGGMADGTWFSFTINVKQNVIAYSEHPTDGDVSSGAVIPGTNEDEIWLSIERNLNSTDVTVIERMTERKVSDVDDYHFVDAGLIYDSTATTTITGLGIQIVTGKHQYC